MTVRGYPELSAKLVLTTCNLLVYLLHPNLVRRFRRRMGHFPNVAFPGTYNEKMFWRKLFDHNPLFCVLSDKLQVKSYIQSRCPDLPCARTLWAGVDPDAIPEALLSGDVVVKASHGSRLNHFVADEEIERTALSKTLARWLRKRHGRSNGEWAYRGVSPKLLVEEMLPLGGDGMPTDLKFHVCMGRVMHVWAFDRVTERSLTLDPDGIPLVARAVEYSAPEKMLPSTPELTALVNKAGQHASALGRDIDYVRVDFLVARDRIWGGEITIYPAAGYDRWTDPAVAKNIAAAWDIRHSAFFRQPHGFLVGLYSRSLLEQLQEAGSPAE